MFDLEFYTLPNGKKPVKIFLDSLNEKMRTKALNSLLILQDQGAAIREPFSKSMGGGIFELRIKFASDISRIFYFFCVNKKIIVTNGFIKKTQETPSNHIDLARKYKAEFERRNKNG